VIIVASVADTYLPAIDSKELRKLERKRCGNGDFHQISGIAGQNQREIAWHSL
jgi:hypothetical protein